MGVTFSGMKSKLKPSSKCLFLQVSTVATSGNFYALWAAYQTIAHMLYLQLQQHLLTQHIAANRLTDSPPTAASPMAATRQLWKGLPVQAWPCRCWWATARLIFYERLGMIQRLASQSVCDAGNTQALRYCYPPMSSRAIHRPKDWVLHSHSESFAEDRNTMKSE